MPDLNVRLIATSYESFFKKPILYRDAKCEDMAQQYFEALASYGLRPGQIALRRGDFAYNFELSVVMFNGSGTFKVTSEKSEINFQNAVGDKDVEIIADSIAKVYEHVKMPEIGNTNITANVHATCESAEEAQKYMERYANPEKQIVRGGTVAYVKSDKWPEEIRMLLEQSMAFPDGLFLAWATHMKEGKITRDILNSVGTAFVEAASRMDITFPKKEQQ